MPALKSLSSASLPASRGKLPPDAVLRELEAMCRALEPGAIVPTHTELMKQLGASERAVRWALDELRRQGRIVRRQGSGTFVADVPLSDNNGSHDKSPIGAKVVPTRSKTVVAIARPDRAVFDQAMGMLFEQAQEAGLPLVCRFADAESKVPVRKEAPPLGYIVFRRDLLPVARKLQAEGQRVVLVGAPFADEMAGVPNVYGDQEYGGYVATKHLLELGHRRLVFFCTQSGLLTRRWVGHQRALIEARKGGLDVQDEVLLIEDAARWTDDMVSARAYFARSDAPTGIVAWNDHEAVMLLNLLQHIGLRVPDDVSLVGYDNLLQGQKMFPPLTTLETSVEGQLQTALKLLTQPEPPTPAHTVVVLPSLVRRESSARIV